MKIILVLVQILWLGIGILLCFENQDELRATKPLRMLAAIFIYLFFAPIFLISNILENFLDFLLNEGDSNGKSTCT